MPGVQDYISSLKAMYIDRPKTSALEDFTSFHIFPHLPTELRRKIWEYAMPERIIEAKLHREGDSWYYRSTTPDRRLDARKMPNLFSVNVESREICAEQYVLFANHFIHPTLDILYITWLLDSRPRHVTEITCRPLGKFQNVVISAGQNRLFRTRFGAMIECIKSLGSPPEISLGLDGPKFPQMLSNMRGYSTATGHQVILLTWNTNTAHNPTYEKTLEGGVTDAFRLEEKATRDLRLPKINERMLYIYSGI
ncbi:uncharacterized protein LY89DRAFT_731354 [Mollisia scopiformis]|uniref:2EXR domain-containing protein n=1 Tax=Mollisia scopiformis TaxID=149040 RepID=A0A194XIY7_MOLSC|nr:uncharacterized protein LY89DRAFT_731354 [Mollisia scopiformis]KUJ20123.1 hypothetical protein LY89DRAFT_731354 [Mollisia scopiformis]